MRQTTLSVLSILVLMISMGCGSANASIQPAPTTAITVSGFFQGAFDSDALCTLSGSQLLTIALNGATTDKTDLTLTILIEQYNQPGTYSVAPNDTNPYSNSADMIRSLIDYWEISNLETTPQGEADTVIINSDSRSGSLDVVLVPELAGTNMITVKGNFTCQKPF